MGSITCDNLLEASATESPDWLESKRRTLGWFRYRHPENEGRKAGDGDAGEQDDGDDDDRSEGDESVNEDMLVETVSEDDRSE